MNCETLQRREPPLRSHLVDVNSSYSRKPELDEMLRRATTSFTGPADINALALLPECIDTTCRSDAVLIPLLKRSSLLIGAPSLPPSDAPSLFLLGEFTKPLCGILF